MSRMGPLRLDGILSAHALTIRNKDTHGELLTYLLALGGQTSLRRKWEGRKRSFETYTRLEIDLCRVMQVPPHS
jgi:hypothetical protein